MHNPYVLIILVLGLGLSTNTTFKAGKSPLPPKRDKKIEKGKVEKKPEEPAIRAEEARKVVGFAAGEDCLEIGKFYHALSSGIVATKSNVVCYSVLQEVERLSIGPATIWQMTEAPPRFYKFRNKYVAADGIYTFETGTTNGLIIKRVGIIPTFEMKMRPLPEPPAPAPPRRPGEIKI